MIVFSDPRCLEYHTPGHPERPYRVEATRRLLEERHPDWSWPAFQPAEESALLRAHSQSHLQRLQHPAPFDADTAYHEGIYELAKLACGAALAAAAAARSGSKAFALVRPPGHHAEWDRAMGFCYLNHAAICALEARASGVARVAVWDFDAHHGNGTQAILADEEGTVYLSVHQHPGYPGTGSTSKGNARNYAVAPSTPPEEHMAQLRASWEELLAFEPELVLVSAGFDAYEHDPITQMTLRLKDFQTIGRWLAACPAPVAALLEGGYSEDLPELVDAFLAVWAQ